VSYSLVETCCGSAALTFHLLGAAGLLVSYQGGKWRYRKSLQKQAEAMGFMGQPDRVILTDPGPFGVAVSVILDSFQRTRVVEKLRELAREDPKAVYGKLNKAVVPWGAVDYTAQFLFLQQLSWGNKAVSGLDGKWRSPGLSKTGAYGNPATATLKAARPKITAFIDKLESLQLAQCSVESHQTVARLPTGQVDRRTLVYIDPPYAGTTGYPDGKISRAQTIDLATAWRDAGASVMISEACPLEIPGWESIEISKGQDGGPLFKRKGPEWLTLAR